MLNNQHRVTVKHPRVVQHSKGNLFEWQKIVASVTDFPKRAVVPENSESELEGDERTLLDHRGKLIITL